MTFSDNHKEKMSVDWFRSHFHWMIFIYYLIAWASTIEHWNTYYGFFVVPSPYLQIKTILAWDRNYEVDQWTCAACMQSSNELFYWVFSKSFTFFFGLFLSILSSLCIIRVYLCQWLLLKIVIHFSWRYFGIEGKGIVVTKWCGWGVFFTSLILITPTRINHEWFFFAAENVKMKAF